MKLEAKLIMITPPTNRHEKKRFIKSKILQQFDNIASMNLHAE